MPEAVGPTMEIRGVISAESKAAIELSAGEPAQNRPIRGAGKREIESVERRQKYGYITGFECTGGQLFEGAP